MYQTEFFKSYELVSRDVYFKLNRDKYKVFNLFDDRILWTADRLRELYGTMTINNWFWGGEFNQRGFRDCSTGVGAEWSQHRFGRGLDASFDRYKAEQIRSDIIEHPFQDEFKYITCLEMDVSWLHMDCRNRDKENLGILKIYP